MKTEVPTISRRTFARITTTSAFAASLLLYSTIPATAKVTPRMNCDIENPGLVSDSSYQGPSFYQSVTWDPAIWEVGDITNKAVSLAVGPVTAPVDCGFGNGGSDLLTLSHRDFDTSVVLIKTVERGMWTFDSMLESMDHPGWMSNLRLPVESDVLLTDHTTDSIAILARDLDNDDHLVYQETFFPPDSETMIRSVTIHFWEPDTYAQTLADTDAIETEDFTLFTVIDRDAILVVMDRP